MKFKLTTMSNKNINSIFENYAPHLEHNMNTTFIKSLFSLIHESNIQPDKYTLTQDTPQVISPYMAPEISEYIKMNEFNHCSTQYRLGAMLVNMNLYSVKRIDVQKYLYFIKLVLWMCVQSSTKKHTAIDIKIVLTPINKTYPSVPVEPASINSGQTAPNKKEIIIFRKEEWLKVFIHECFHLFCLDFCDVHFNAVPIFKQMYHVNSEFLIFESFTELWARTVNISIISYHTKDNITYEEYEQLMKINLQVERIYCIAQMNHVLNKMGYTYEDLIHFKKPILQEKTNFFCYYVLTSVLFYYYDDTMKWFIKHNSLVQFSKSKVHHFFQFIKQIHNRPQLLHFIKKINKPLFNCNMSAFEIAF